MTCPTPTKHEFASERAAKRALRSLRSPQGRMKAYPCGGHWHLGHTGVMGERWSSRKLKGRPKTTHPTDTPFIVVGAHQALVGGVCLNISHGTAPDSIDSTLRARLASRGVPVGLIAVITRTDDVMTAAALLEATSEQLAEISTAWKQPTHEGTHQ